MNSKYCKLFPKFLERCIITNRRGSSEFQMKGFTVCLDNVSFVLCTPLIIKEKEMASVMTLIKIPNASKEQPILLLIFPLFEVSVKSLVIANKFVVYATFVEAVQRFEHHQYNIPILS